MDSRLTKYVLAVLFQIVQSYYVHLHLITEL